MIQKLAPIILFTYKRPLHTQKVLDALATNIEAKDSVLYVYCDGAKDNASEDDLIKIEEVRGIFKTENRFKEIILTTHAQNKGLANSIVSGVTEVIKKHGTAIIVEDDIVTAPFFLKYMNETLTLYKDSIEVACITGYVFPTKEKLPDTFFLKGAECWGWATWSRVWDQYNGNSKDLLAELEQQKRQYEFDYNGTYPHYQMLKDQIAGKNNSWAICWYATAFLKDMLTLYPGVSLVRNIGFDGSGEHCGEDQNEAVISDKAITVRYAPPKEDNKARLIVARYFSGKNNQPRSIRNFLRRLLANRRIKNFWDKIKHGGINNYKNFTQWDNHSDLLDYWGSKNVWVEFLEYSKDWNGNVIDVGCGTGKVMQILRTQNPKVNIFGIEPGVDLVKQCQNNGIHENEIENSTFSAFLQKNNYEYKTDYLYSIAVLQYFNLTELKELIEFLRKNLKKQAVIFVSVSNDNLDGGIYLSWQTYNRMSKTWWKNLFEERLKMFDIEVFDSKWTDEECVGIWLILNRVK